MNWPQAVIRVSYQAAEIPETVMMEDANVSEQCNDTGEAEV